MATLILPMLQWGRGCYAAETDTYFLNFDHLFLLQWGRGCYAAETVRQVYNHGDGAAMLQWGRGCYAAETA